MVNKRRNTLCTLCYKPAAQNEENNEIGNSSQTKFLFLLLRHLKMQPKLHKFKNEFMCCEDCALLANSFCDLYFQRECIQLQLNWKLKRVYETMVCAERVPSRVNAFRTQFKSSQNEQECDDDKPSQSVFKEIQVARKRLIKNCKLKLKSSKPGVLLQRISNNGNNSTGVEMKSEKQSPKKLSTACHDGRVPDFEMSMDMDYKETFECDTADPELVTLTQLHSPSLDNDDDCDYYEDREGRLEEMDSAQETSEDKISSEMDVQNVTKIDTSDMKRHENCQIEKLQSVVGDGDGPIVTENLNHSEMRECSSSIHETPLQLSPEIPSIRVEMTTPNAISVDAEESRGRKSLRSRLKCLKCSKTFTNQASMDLHAKLHEENVIHDQPSESDSDSDAIKNEEVVGDTEFMEDEDEEVDKDVAHSDVDAEGCSESETELPPRIKSRGRPVPGPHNKPRTAKLPFTQCEICLVNYDCEAAVEKCRVVNHKLHKYVCCHSCQKFFNCHRHLVRHRKGRQRCSPKNPSDLEPAAAPLFPSPSGRQILGNKFCTVEGCYEVFQYEEWLQVHLKTHGKWDCTVCPAEFGKAHELAVHELNEHKNKPLAAESEATSEETVEMSKKMQKMAKKPFSCTRCHKKYDKKACIISHFVNEHLGIPRWAETVKVKCEICKNPMDAASRANIMKIHVQSQHNVEGMDPTAISKCTICQAPFRLRQQLTTHMRLVHKQTPEYKCPHCGKANFRNHNAFLMHLRKVHKGKPSGLVGALECDICKDRFTNEQHLQRHLKSHVDDDKLVFTCETCQKTFSKRVNLNNHIKNVHEQPKQTWHCDKCAKVFKTKAKLDQHTSYTHTDPSQWKFACPEKGCGKRCWSRQKLTEHIRTHTKERPFICDFCGEAYRFRQYLRTHLAKVHGETAAKTLPTQGYTKPFDQEMREKEVAAGNESEPDNSLDVSND